MEKVLKIIKKGQDEENLKYWVSLSYEERMIELEKIRQEVKKHQYETRQELQRVYKIIKRA